MLTRRELTALAVSVLCALAAVLVGACTTTPKLVYPNDYPCKDEAGKVYGCSADEWMYQKLTRKDGDLAQKEQTK